MQDKTGNNITQRTLIFLIVIGHYDLVIPWYFCLGCL